MVSTLAPRSTTRDDGTPRSRWTRWTPVVARVSLIAQILLVTTGGLVRLTDSGLGCPTWPRCSAGSYTTTPALGVHGVIEFVNRMLTVALVLVVVAAVVVVAVDLTRSRTWRSRSVLAVLAGLQLISIPAQAVIGGITVLTHLNPWLVGLHFAFSMVLVALMAWFVVRATTSTGRRRLVVPASAAVLTGVSALLVAVAVGLGVVTTGSGPHAGDARSARNGLPQWLLQDVHAASAFALVAVSLVLLVLALRRGVRRRPVVALVVIEAAQVAVGITQAKYGLPPLLVDVHELLAACLVAAMAFVVLACRAPEPQPTR